MKRTIAVVAMMLSLTACKAEAPKWLVRLCEDPAVSGHVVQRDGLWQCDSPILGPGVFVDD